MIYQLNLFEKNNSHKGKFATHSGGKGEIFHDWYPYLEGFSSSFVDSVRREYLPKKKCIFEPFAGVGTTPIYLSMYQVECIYCEINPVLQHLILTKSKVLTQNHNLLNQLKKEILEIKIQLNEIHKFPECKLLDENYKFLFKNSIYFEEKNYKIILKIKNFIRTFKPSLKKSILEVSIYSSLLECSLLKRAGDVRYRTKSELKKSPPLDIIKTVIQKIDLMLKDIDKIDQKYTAPIFFHNNSKNISKLKKINADGVITSPPYLNGTNYFRNTRLEMWFMEFINKKILLRDFRDETVTAGINDVNSKEFKSIIPEVYNTYKKVSKNAYDTRIPKMIADYFHDMQLVFEGLNKHLKKKGIVCMDIGDSIYNHIHIPTDKILIEVAKNINFKLLDEVFLRSRTSHSKVKLSQKLLVFEKL